MLHSELFPEYPCDGELIAVKVLPMERLRPISCSGCDAVIRFTPDFEWMLIVYPGTSQPRVRKL